MSVFIGSTIGNIGQDNLSTISRCVVRQFLTYNNADFRDDSTIEIWENGDVVETLKFDMRRFTPTVHTITLRNGRPERYVYNYDDGADVIAYGGTAAILHTTQAISPDSSGFFTDDQRLASLDG